MILLLLDYTTLIFHIRYSVALVCLLPFFFFFWLSLLFCFVFCCRCICTLKRKFSQVIHEYIVLRVGAHDDHNHDNDDEVLWPLSFIISSASRLLSLSSFPVPQNTRLHLRERFCQYLRTIDFVVGFSVTSCWLACSIKAYHPHP